MRNDFSGIYAYDYIYQFIELDALEHQYLPTSFAMFLCIAWILMLPPRYIIGHLIYSL